MTPDELRRLDNDLCIILEKGLKPIKAPKYYYFKYSTEKLVQKYACSHNSVPPIDRGKWRKYNPYNPYVEDKVDEKEVDGRNVIDDYKIIRNEIKKYDENLYNKKEIIVANKIEVELVKTVDGDTAKFKMDGEQVTVRFLGINTKETVHPEIGEEEWGKEASDFTKGKLENATKIELEFDKIADKKDKYDRYLAWIWVDGELLQNLLVQNGLAETYMLQNNYKYAGMLQESEELAKESKLGIWRYGCI